jgi:aspartate-semialdehyde dehydrogenase
MSLDNSNINVTNTPIVIVGTSGLVGQEFIKLIENDGRFTTLIFVGSEKSKGTTIMFKEIINIIVTLDELDWTQNYIFINCADKQQAREIRKNMSSQSIMIDNSSEFRLDEDVPLVIPEINFPKEKYQIYANPNCSTIILDLLLAPLEYKYGIRRVVVSTYQAASGAGKLGLEELLVQNSQFANNQELEKSYWNKQYIFNTFVHNSSIQENFYNEEENKIINETQKIMDKKIPITATCIRVPVLRSHCESVNVELIKETSIDEIYKILAKCPFLEIVDDKMNNIFPESITTNNQTKVQVGHIRQDNSLPSGLGWNFWLSADQLIRGAAYNAYLILDKIVESTNTSTAVISL